MSSTKEQHQNGRRVFDKEPAEEAAKIERIAGHTAGLVDDLKSWFELKIEFVLLDFKEEMKSTGLQFAYQVGALVVLLVAVFFGLVALALGLGVWLGHAAWGFLAVMGLLVLVALGIKWFGDRAKKRKKGPEDVYPQDIGQQKLPEGAIDKGKKLAEGSTARKAPELSEGQHAEG